MRSKSLFYLILLATALCCFSGGQAAFRIEEGKTNWHVLKKFYMCVYIYLFACLVPMRPDVSFGQGVETTIFWMIEASTLKGSRLKL